MTGAGVQRGMQIIAALVVLCLASIAPQTERHPDFSGTWTFDRSKSMKPGPDGRIVLATVLGDTFEAKQDASRLTLVITAGSLKVTATYNFEGESRNQSPSGTGGPDLLVTSRVSWDGDALVILSRSTSVTNGRDVLVETKRVLRIDADGDLIVERTGTPASEVTPSRSVYRRLLTRQRAGRGG